MFDAQLGAWAGVAACARPAREPDGPAGGVVGAPCLLAPQPATAQFAPMLPSPRNSRTALYRHTGPQIRRTRRPDLHRYNPPSLIT